MPDTDRRGSTGGLLKVLGVAFGLAVVVGNSIGMGILRTPGEIAAHLTSAPLFMMIWVAGATYALMGAVSVAELGAMYPRAGGLYPPVAKALGPFPGFVVGWSDWISSCGSAAAVAIVFGEYIGPLIPALDGRPSSIAGGVVLGFAALQWRGIKMGDIVQQFTSLIKAVALIGLAVVAIIMSPSQPATATTEVVTQIPSGIALVVAIIVAMQSAIFTYDGWGGVLYFGEETKNPGRDIPRSMIGGVLLVLLIYLALNIAFLRVIPIEEMAGDPFVAATAAARLFGPNGDTILRILMGISLIAAVNAIMLMGARVPFAMSRDGYLPSPLTQVNRGGTPTTALLVSTAITLGFIATNTFDAVLALLAFFFVINYTLLFASVFVMRRKFPDAERPFKAPGYPWVPGLALIGSIAFLVASVFGDTTNSLRSIGLLALSIPVFLISQRRLRS